MNWTPLLWFLLGLAVGTLIINFNFRGNGE